MPTWLTIVLACGGSALISWFVPWAMNGFVTWHKMHKDMEARAEIAREQRIKESEANRQKDRDQMQADMKQLSTELQLCLTPLKLGTQQLLRNELNKMYNAAKRRGWTTDDEKKMFDSLYQTYHSLGRNGVMDHKYEEFLCMDEKSNEELYKNRKGE